MEEGWRNGAEIHASFGTHFLPLPQRNVAPVLWAADAIKPARIGKQNIVRFTWVVRRTDCCLASKKKIKSKGLGWLLEHIGRARNVVKYMEMISRENPFCM